MKILMVCLGNICRSPLAEGIMRQKIKQNGLPWTVESAGTSGWHAGSRPHAGSINIARAHGIDITHQRSRQIVSQDLQTYDLIIAMDAQNYQDICALTDDEALHEKVSLLLNYSHPEKNRAVPDPYYTGDFDTVFALIDEACEQLILKYHSNPTKEY